MAISFQGAYFPEAIILPWVRWYVAYPLSSRNLEEMMPERQVSSDHSTINRCVIKYSPNSKPTWPCGREDVMGPNKYG